MEALNTNAERQALRACELEAFKAIKLDALKDKVAQLLAHIGDGGIFDQYTKHDITHVNKMLESLDNIIPASTQDVMTAADWILIVVSTYFHDLGMLVTKNEFQNRNDAEPFRDFRKEYLADVDNAQSLSGLSDEDKERFVYQEYVRHHHGDRVASWIEVMKMLGAIQTHRYKRYLTRWLKIFDQCLKMTWQQFAKVIIWMI